VIAGQRTVGVEVGHCVRGPMTIVCPVGGGGLLSGIALWASEHPDVRVVGVEAAASRALSSAVRVGHVVEVPISPTLADGIAGGLEVDSVTVQIARRHVYDLIAVSEGELRHAIRELTFEQGLVVEGAGAVACRRPLRTRGRSSGSRAGRGSAIGTQHRRSDVARRPPGALGLSSQS